MINLLVNVLIVVIEQKNGRLKQEKRKIRKRQYVTQCTSGEESTDSDDTDETEHISKKICSNCTCYCKALYMLDLFSIIRKETKEVIRKSHLILFPVLVHVCEYFYTLLLEYFQELYSRQWWKQGGLRKQIHSLLC